MREKLKRYCAFALVLAMLCQVLTGCFGKGASPPASNNAISEKEFKENYIQESYIEEDLLKEAYITEHLIYENNIYAYKISEDFFSEAYVIELVVGEDAEEEIFNQLPKQIEEYDIDWPKVVGKFAVGTSIIIAVGVVNYISQGSTYFVFGTAASVAKDAFIGGAIAATMNEVVCHLKDGKMPQKAVTKYAIEGFADGYMWGAIASVTKIAGENFKRLKAFRLATGGTASIKPDGRVFDEAGKLLGKAYYEKKGLWYLLDDASNVMQVFDKAGKAVTDPKILATLKTLPENSMVRLGPVEDAALCYTDDLGKIIRVGNELVAESSFQLNGYKYYTDKFGRISKVVFDDLKLKPEDQSRPLIEGGMDLIGKGYGLRTDDRGHLIADMFGGDNTLANIVPMGQNVNRSKVKSIELGWQSCLQKGGHVNGSIELKYLGESFRPESFNYVYDMGGGIVQKLIENIA